jgi:hypothetical protein
MLCSYEDNKQDYSGFYRWDDSVTMELTETDVNVMKGMGLAVERDYWTTIVNMAVNLHVTNATVC